MYKKIMTSDDNSKQEGLRVERIPFWGAMGRSDSGIIAIGDIVVGT